MWYNDPHIEHEYLDETEAKLCRIARNVHAAMVTQTPKKEE